MPKGHRCIHSNSSILLRNLHSAHVQVKPPWFACTIFQTRLLRQCGWALRYNPNCLVIADGSNQDRFCVPIWIALLIRTGFVVAMPNADELLVFNPCLFVNPDGLY